MLLIQLQVLLRIVFWGRGWADGSVGNSARSASIRTWVSIPSTLIKYQAWLCGSVNLARGGKDRQIPRGHWQGSLAETASFGSGEDSQRSKTLSKTSDTQCSALGSTRKGWFTHPHTYVYTMYVCTHWGAGKTVLFMTSLAKQNSWKMQILSVPQGWGVSCAEAT